MQSYDYIIAGSGIAGLYSAILAREHGTVLVLTKGSIAECNTMFAQGGIAAAIGRGDSAALHYKDTVAAGAGLGDPESIRILTEEAPDRIRDLIRLGVRFDTDYGQIALAKEGAHSRARVLHAGGDSTGRYIEQSLSDVVRRDEVDIREHALLTGVLRNGAGVRGVRVFDARAGRVEEIGCRKVVIATGGAGRLFKYTTNPEVAMGDGVAVAFRAGAEVMDMEFFQFHPTALRLEGAPSFLISEAVRGEGGILRNERGRAFMEDYTPEKELAPRDVVARAILAEMRKTGAGHVYLDMRHLRGLTIPMRFPQIYQTCLDYGVDITKEMIPVAPAAHYMMGGVRTNGSGETNVPGLYAVGEAACTGAHGANRLASNSLLETVVFAKRMVQRSIGETPVEATTARAEERHEAPRREAGAGRLAAPTLGALQELMWKHVGMERNEAGLTLAAETLAAWEQRVAAPDYLVSAGTQERASYELASAITTARLMAEAALLRRESRGSHYRSDYPATDAGWVKHVVLTG